MSCSKVLAVPAYSHAEANKSMNEASDCYELTAAATRASKLDVNGDAASSSRLQLFNVQFSPDVKTFRATRRSLDRAAKKRDTSSKRERRKYRIVSNKRPRIVHCSQQMKYDPDDVVEAQEDTVIELDNEWASVPLAGNGTDEVKGEDEGPALRENSLGSGADRYALPEKEAVVVEEAVEVKKVEEEVKLDQVATESEHQFLDRICSILQGSAEIVKRNVQAETYDTSICPRLRDLQSHAKRLAEEAEQGVLLIREQELRRRITAEKAEREASMAAEKLQLLQKIDHLELENRKIANEKLTVEHERDSMRADFEGMLQKARESVRDDLEKQYAVTEESFRKELAIEQEKTCCQICFASPRNALILPCLHFQYCNECLQMHQNRSKECPTCRTMISGVLRCALTPS